MRRCTVSLFAALLALALLIPGADLAEAAYRIVLKNGSSITVESYKKINGRIQFYRSGGMMEIDSSEILEIKEISGQPSEDGEVRALTPETQPSTVQPPPSSTYGENEEIRSRLEELQKEKEVLKKEAQEVMEEVEKLNQEIKREGRVLAIRKKRELEKRKEELENRVSDINKRIEALNSEEEDLLRRLWRY